MSRTASPTDVNLLELAPRRVASWSEDDGRVVVQRRAPASPWRTPFEWLGYAMSTKRIRLDEVGSSAWKMLDGHHTVAEVAERLRAEFGERVEPAEERLGLLISMLYREGLVGYAGCGRTDPEGWIEGW